MMVPAVTEVWRPHSAHSKVQALVSSRQALSPLQFGQTNPSRHRVATRYSAQAASSLKRCWNSINERGKSVIAAIESSYVRDLFYHTHAPAATTFCAPGRTGIRLLSCLASRPLPKIDKSESVLR